MHGYGAWHAQPPHVPWRLLPDWMSRPKGKVATGSPLRQTQANGIVVDPGGYGTGSPAETLHLRRIDAGVPPPVPKPYRR